MKNTKSLTDNEEYKDIASRITHLRNDILHMTQAEFSSVLKISQTYLSLIEAGKKSVPQTMIENIISKFDVTMEWLIIGIGSDETIFAHQHHPITKDSLLQSISSSAFNELKKTYRLADNELEFVQWFVTLPSKERELYLSGLNYIAAISHLYPPGSS